MPLFEFDCRACGEGFERLIPSSVLSTVKCPACDSGDIKKRFSRFGVRSSGSGDGGGSQGSSCGSCSSSNCGTCATG